MPTIKSFVFSDSLLLLLLLSPFCHGGSDGGAVKQELWCVAKNNAEDAALQTALDWACGAGGADCGPIQNGGPCYDVNSVQNTASYAFNDYFLKHGLTDDSCSFNNNAAVTSLNPSEFVFVYLSMVQFGFVLDLGYLEIGMHAMLLLWMTKNCVFEGFLDDFCCVEVLLFFGF